ncbi:MAG: chromosomal replication initiator protein DnaA [Bacteroidia bacterium]|nr:chromosomal replication initiator protein DnaA [Bacteroidia bacterium]
MAESVEILWDKCLESLGQRVSKSNYDTWFSPLKPLKLEGQVLTILAPSNYFIETIEKNFLGVLGDVLRQFIGEGAGLRYAVNTFQQNPKFKAEQVDIDRRIPIPGGDSKSNAQFNPFIQSEQARKPIVDPQLSYDFTFENYVTGDCNKFACAIANEVAKKPGGAYNPFFVHGQSGVGKTHLIQAIGAQVKKLDQDKTIIYLSADRFMRQYMDAKRGNQINGFIAFYQMVDVLIVDDIQDLSGREGTASAFFQIFNYLIQSKKQIVIAADKRPSEIVGLEDRMLTRFKAGIIAEVTRPDFETRVRIIERKLAKDGIVVSPEIVNFIAENLQNNVRELEGCILALMARAAVTHSEITMDVARSVVGSFASTMTKKISLESISEVVAAHFKVPVEELTKKSRKQDVVMARQVAMYFAKQLTDFSLAAIGKQIADRNHATVLYSVKAVQDKMSVDKSFASMMKQLEMEIKS